MIDILKTFILFSLTDIYNFIKQNFLFESVKIKLDKSYYIVMKAYENKLYFLRITFNDELCLVN